MTTPNSIVHGSRVQWEERYGTVTCTGTVVANCTDWKGNQTDYWTVKVDEAYWHTACHTAYEMHTQWVDRSTKWSKLRLVETTAQ